MKFRDAHFGWEAKIEEAVGKALCASPMRLACFLVGIHSPGFIRHIGYSDTPPKTVRSRIEPILKRIASGTVGDLKVLTEGFEVGELLGYAGNGVPLWVVRHLAGLLDVNLPAEPKLEDFLPKADAATSDKPKKGVCRKCGCTEDASFRAGGRAWNDRARTLCTRCANGQAKVGTKARAKAKKKPARK